MEECAKCGKDIGFKRAIAYEGQIYCTVVCARLDGANTGDYETVQPQDIGIKPSVKLVGEDGNIFSILARSARALKRAGLGDQAKQMRQEVMESNSYDEALSTILQYVQEEGE